MWSYDIKCKYTLIFSLKNLVCKEITYLICRQHIWSLPAIVAPLISISDCEYNLPKFADGLFLDWGPRTGGELTPDVGRIYVCDCFDVGQTLRSPVNKPNYSIYNSFRIDQLNQHCPNIAIQISEAVFSISNECIEVIKNTNKILTNYCFFSRLNMFASTGG